MGKRLQLRLIFLLMGAIVSTPVIIMMSLLNQGVPHMVEEECWRSTDPSQFECWMPSDTLQVGGKLDSALVAAKGESSFVYIILVDTMHIKLALNLHETSFKQLQIDNYLFICADRTAVDLMFVRGIGCYGYPYPQEYSQEGGGSYEHRELSLVLRSQMQTKVALSALLLGHAILLLDLDAILRHDVAPFISSSRADLLLPSDYQQSSFSYYFAKPLYWVKELHVRALELHRLTPESPSSELFFLSQALDIMTQRHEHLAVGIFDPLYFPGNQHATDQGSNYSTCVIVINKDSLSIEEKIYQLKESKLWMLDYGYYSDRGRKYISYHNNIDFGEKNVEYELKALKNALFIGELLNRTVILPKFSCSSCPKDKCPPSKRKCFLDKHVSIAAFDRFFSGKYRESAFLTHPLINRRVKKSRSQVILIKTEFVRLLHPRQLKSNSSTRVVLAFTPSNPIVGTKPGDIMLWFDRPPFKNFSVLRFHSLYDVFKWPLPTWSLDFMTFEGKIKRSFETKEHSFNSQSLDVVKRVLSRWLVDSEKGCY